MYLTASCSYTFIVKNDKIQFEVSHLQHRFLVSLALFIKAVFTHSFQ